MSATNHRGIQASMDPLYRRVIVDHLYLRIKRLNGTWYVDTLISKVKSVIGNTVSNVYAWGGCVRVYPITA